MTTAESTLTVQAGQIAAKASQTSVDSLTGRISSAEASLTVQAGKSHQRQVKVPLMR